MDPSKFGMNPQLTCGNGASPHLQGRGASGPSPANNNNNAPSAEGGGGGSGSSTALGGGGGGGGGGGCFNNAWNALRQQQLYPGFPAAMMGMPGMMMMAPPHGGGAGAAGMMGGAGAGGFGAPAGQVPLLIGASPFQQQLAALQQSLGGPAAAPAGGFPGTAQIGGLYGMPSSGGNLAGFGGGQQQQQQQQQGLKRDSQTSKDQQRGSEGSRGMGDGSQGQTNSNDKEDKEERNAKQQRVAGGGSPSGNAGGGNPAPSPSVHGMPGIGGMGGFNQNTLLSAAAMGGNMGFNLQQIQSLQMAQQLMAAGVPPNLAFCSAFQQPGAMCNPLVMAGLAANPMMAGHGAVGGTFGTLSMNGGAPTGFGAPGTGLLGMNGMTGAGPGVGGAMGAGACAPAATNPMLAGGLSGAPGGLKTTAPGADVSKAGAVAAGSDPSNADWAEPFSGKGKKEPPFPLKLHQILSNPEFSECICWNPHGRSWRILKPPVFEQVVIPLYFRHAKYASFMRQVNGWGFKRIVSGNDHNSYFHELFLRDYPQMCLKMKRIRKGDKQGDEDSDGGVVEGKAAHDDEEHGDEKSEGEPSTAVAKKEVKVEGYTDVPAARAPATATDTTNGLPSMAGLGFPTGNTGLAMASPGFNPYAALQEQLSNGPVGGWSGLSSAKAAMQGMPGLGGMPGMGGGTNGSAGAPCSVGGMDNSSLLKIQEALQSGRSVGSFLLQQQQQNAAGPSAANFTNLNFLQGPLGGALAAQLQAATQAPSLGNDPNSKNKDPSLSTMNGIGMFSQQQQEQQRQQQEQQRQLQEQQRQEEDEQDDLGDDDDLSSGSD